MDQYKTKITTVIRTHKKLLMGVLVLGVLGVVTSLIMMQRFMGREEQTPDSAQKKEQAEHARLYFSPHDITQDSRFPYRTVYINLSGVRSVSGVELELQYDPAALQNVSLLVPQSSIFKAHGGYRILKNEHDKKQGRISLSLGVTDDQQPLDADGVVAALSYAVLPGYTQASTPVTFLPTSIVTQLGSSTPVPLTTKSLIIRTGK